jgi:Rhamnan synthesis protein F/Nucleotide-diphospho-sugar transferase
VFTSFTYAYLSRARVLAKSIRRRHSDWVIWAVLVDVAPASINDEEWRRDFDYVLDASTLYPGIWFRWIFKHDIVEACTAVKAHALLEIMSRGADKVIYLDPDIAVFDSLQPLIEELDKASIILIPHQAEPNLTEAEILDNEYTSMLTGVFNLGFIGVRNDEQGRRMAKWWASRLFHACYDDKPSGIFTDQKYCDLIPCLFDNVKIERGPGYNVASWNISRRMLEFSRDGGILVNGDTLRFYHFTKINSDGDVMTARYSGNSLAVADIWNWYKRAIKLAEVPGIPENYWFYSKFEDGVKIPRSARIHYRSDPGLMRRFPMPFVVGEGSFRNCLRPNEVASDSKHVARIKDPYTTGADSVGAVIHCYYPELLSEIVELLSAYAGYIKLYVTVGSDRQGRVERILNRSLHPYEIICVENRGRDILPFIRVLPDVLGAGHDYIIKLHTKRSRHRRDGDRWRRELLMSLADPSELAWTIRALNRRSDIGIVGPENHVLNLDAYWGSNESRVRELLARIGASGIVPDPKAFVAGSMFVARKDALSALLSLNLAREEFEEEKGQTDGTLAHAVERLFAFSAAIGGLRVGGKATNAAGTEGGFILGGKSAYGFAPRSDLGGAA